MVSCKLCSSLEDSKINVLTGGDDGILEALQKSEDPRRNIVAGGDNVVLETSAAVWKRNILTEGDCSISDTLQ